MIPHPPPPLWMSEEKPSGLLNAPAKSKLILLLHLFDYNGKNSTFCSVASSPIVSCAILSPQHVCLPTSR